MAPVGLGNIRMAQTLLGGVAARAGENGDPHAIMERWVLDQGIDLDGLIAASEAVADDEVEEIMALLEDGGSFEEPQIRETIVDVYRQAFLVAWICHGRADRREVSERRGRESE